MLLSVVFCATLILLPGCSRAPKPQRALPDFTLTAVTVDGTSPFDRSTLRGRTLTFDLAGDRILTESARGGRTWITLKPEAKEVQPVEPKTKH